MMLATAIAWLRFLLHQMHKRKSVGLLANDSLLQFFPAFPQDFSRSHFTIQGSIYFWHLLRKERRDKRANNTVTEKRSTTQSAEEIGE